MNFIEYSNDMSLRYSKNGEIDCFIIEKLNTPQITIYVIYKGYIIEVSLKVNSNMKTLILTS